MLTVHFPPIGQTPPDAGALDVHEASYLQARHLMPGLYDRPEPLASKGYCMRIR